MQSLDLTPRSSGPGCVWPLNFFVAAEGIRVNAVVPGIIYTDIHVSGGEPGRVERLKETIPMKRGGYPEEVARAVLWLLSDAASYSTGALLHVTGGR